jgi:CelD/BcsL family acetyltransferase involved in cellulose biosynthesis
MLSLLTRQSFRFKYCDFQDLRSDSRLLLEEASIQDVCPVLELWQDIPMLKKADYYLRHAGKFGEVHIEQATGQNFEKLFAEFLRLHRSRWGDEGVLNDAALKQFHREVASEFLDAGMLRLYVLYLDSRPIAAWYGFESNKRVYYYLGGFDPEFQKFSPGTILIGHAIKEAIAGGARELDFLRGTERYKYSWGGRDRPTYRLQMRFRNYG